MANESSVPTHRIDHLDDRIAVIVDNATGQRSVTYGDGRTIPFGAFMNEEVHAMASAFLLSPNSNVTAFDPKQLAGLIGALLARQSRMNGSVVDVLAKEFLHPDGTVNREKAEALIGRVLLQFGDDSVQEYETATVLFVSISNLATKMIEDRRLGSFIEQSSRYVYYWQRDPVNGAWRYYREPRIMGSDLGVRYTELMDRCFETYVTLIEKLTAYYGQVKPPEEAAYAVRPDDKKKYRRVELNADEQREFDRVYKTDLKTRACDTARIVLPASTMTNMAMVANGRTFEYLLKVLFASDVPEFVDIGTRTHETLGKIIPQYVKRADPKGDDFLRELRLAGSRMAKTFPGVMDGDVKDEVEFLELPRLIADTTTAQSSMLAAALYPHVRCSYAKLVQAIDDSGRHLPGLIGTLVGERKNRRDRSPRGFEHGYPITVEITGNFGIYRDLQRHRMLTMNRQNLTPHLGFTVPADVEAIGMGGIVRALAADISDLYGAIDGTIGADAAEYCVLFGHHLRFKIGMNLREAQHLLELRTIPQGHPDYRRICQKIHNEIIARAPWLAETGILNFVDHNAYDWARADAEARQSQKAQKMGFKLE